MLAGDHLIAKAGRAEADYRLARRHVGDVATHGFDHARKFEAQGRPREAVLNRFIGEQAQGVHHIAEVKPGGFNADGHFVSIGWR